tara:strand:- start:629 stop:1630 length:1002 start_codon:yes stop_codon:yes gene_type:complete
MQQAFEWLFKDELLDGYIVSLTLEQIAIAEILAVMFFVIGVVYNVLTTVVKSRGMQPINFGEFGRIIVIMFALGLYIPLIGFPVKVIDLINQATSPSSDEIIDYSLKLGEHTYENGLIGSLEREFVPDPEDQPVEDIHVEELTLWDYLGTALSPASAGAFFLDTIVVSLASVVRVIMQALLKVLSLILFVFGPYAFVASILPIWKDKISVWFNSFITIYFCYVVFNILDRILYYNLFKDLFSSMGGNEFTAHQSLVLNIAILIVYLLPFWISSKVVGSSDSGRFLSMFAQVSTAMTYAGLSKVGGFKQLASISGGTQASGKSGGVAKDAMSTK